MVRYGTLDAGKSKGASKPILPVTMGRVVKRETNCEKGEEECASLEPWVQANLHRSYTQYNEDLLEGCAKQSEFRSIVFALCYFHAALLERKKFGVGNLVGATSGVHSL